MAHLLDNVTKHVRALTDEQITAGITRVVRHAKRAGTLSEWSPHYRTRRVVVQHEVTQFNNRSKTQEVPE